MQLATRPTIAAFTASKRCQNVALLSPCTARRRCLVQHVRQEPLGGRARHICSAKPGGVIDAPSSSTSTTLEKGTAGQFKRAPIYKLMLHNDNHNRREHVVSTLLKVVQGYTVDDAVVVMTEAHEQGVAMVIACPQDEAEKYCEGLRGNGLSSSIEPGC